MNSVSANAAQLERTAVGSDAHANDFPPWSRRRMMAAILVANRKAPRKSMRPILDAFDDAFDEAGGVSLS